MTEGISDKGLSCLVGQKIAAPRRRQVGGKAGNRAFAICPRRVHGIPSLGGQIDGGILLGSGTHVALDDGQTFELLRQLIQMSNGRRKGIRERIL